MDNVQTSFDFEIVSELDFYSRAFSTCINSQGLQEHTDINFQVRERYLR